MLSVRGNTLYGETEIIKDATLLSIMVYLIGILTSLVPIGRTLAAGNVVEESGCLYISSVAADGNPISREQHHEMGLPSADALKM